MNTTNRIAAPFVLGLMFSSTVMAEPALRTAIQEDSAYVKLSVVQLDKTFDNKRGLASDKQDLELTATSLELTKTLASQGEYTPIFSYGLLDISQEFDGVEGDDYMDMTFSAGVMKKAGNGHSHVLTASYYSTDNEGSQDSLIAGGRFYLGQSNSGKLQHNFDTELSYYMDEGATSGGHELSASVYSNYEVDPKFNMTGLLSVTFETDLDSEAFDKIESKPSLQLGVRALYNVIENYFVGLSAEHTKQEKTYQQQGLLDITSQQNSTIVRLMMSADF